jgi:UDP-N-acetyl-D-mannosaminuronate dehydrogenase
MKNKIGIVGYGEIGQALYDVYHEYDEYNIKIYDPFKNFFEDIDNCEILNICIPYDKKFVDTVNEYINKYNPRITIIHSTVSPGTTKDIIGPVCHSPVRGLHPNLKIGIKTFLKYIGSENNAWAIEYSQHLSKLGIDYYICKNSLTTEFAKLFDTTYYGLLIAFHSDVNKLCNQYDLDFNEVMTTYNKSYNNGYSELGLTDVIRPTLYPTQKIGGHCIVPNAKILKNYFKALSIENILQYEEDNGFW